jgi:hypothetical protein
MEGMTGWGGTACMGCMRIGTLIVAKESGVKRIFECAVERMAKARLVKEEEAFAGHAEMAAGLLLRRTDLGGGQVAAVNEVANGLPGGREELRHVAQFDQGRDGMLGSVAANCDHNVYLEWFKLMYKKDIGAGLGKVSDFSQRYV